MHPSFLSRATLQPPPRVSLGPAQPSPSPPPGPSRGARAWPPHRPHRHETLNLDFLPLKGLGTHREPNRWVAFKQKMTLIVTKYNERLLYISLEPEAQISLSGFHCS